MLSPANGGDHAIAYVAPEPRQLPTARQLAEVHMAHQLQDLMFLAIRLDDKPVQALIEAAKVERMRIDLQSALDLPALLAKQRAEATEKEQAGWMSPAARRAPIALASFGQSGDQRG